MRLTYEALTSAHADALWPLFQDPELWRWIPGNDGNTLEAMRARYARWAAGPREWVNHAVLLDGKPIGRVQATVHGDWAEIAYVIARAHWGHGYGREATAWLRDQLALDELWAAIDPRNHASERLLRALGFAPAPTGLRKLESEDPGDSLYRWTRGAGIDAPCVNSAS